MGTPLTQREGTAMSTEQMTGWQEPTEQMRSSGEKPEKKQSDDVGMVQEKIKTSEPQAS